MAPVEDTETLLLELWKVRNDKDKIAAVCKKMIVVAPSDLDKVEMYLPQLSHMIIALPDVMPTVEPIEAFVLSVCQLSIHIALQFFWLLYAALQENRPKLGMDRDTYRHCASLLVQLEQCIVYGGGSKLATASASEFSEADIMQECVRVAKAAADGERTLRAGAKAGTPSVVLSGKLMKQGGGTSRFGRKTWHERHFEICDRVLYYYSTEAHAVADKQSKLDKPRGSMQLTTAVVSAPKHERPNVFEVKCKQSGLKFCVQAPTKEVMGKWILAIRAVAALPEPPGMQAADVNKLFTSILAEEAAGGSGDGANVERAVSDKYSDSSAFHRVHSSSSLSSQGGEGNADIAAANGGGAAGSGGAALASGREVYHFFNSQREFVRTLTNLAEELRYMPAEQRQTALQPALDNIPLPPGTYFPLAHSANFCLRLLRFTPDESIVFNTKARCPIMLLCEVEKKAYTLSDLHKNLPSPSSSAAVSPSDVAVSSASGMTVKQKKSEPWPAKAKRLKEGSALAASIPSWDLTSFIVKSNDDLRQEVFIMQMIRYFASIWPADKTWLNCYHIEATGPDTGLIQTIIASSDLDHLKKREGYTSLKNLFIERHGPPGSPGFLAAQDNFVKSLAAYSIVMWLLKLRDRHNGNLMVDEQGHYFHIDFGFCLGHSTGKGIGGMVECSNFKLTEEYIEMLDGRHSPVFERYCQGCVAAMQASHTYASTILSMVEIVGTKSVFPCFENLPVQTVIPRLKKRLFTHKPAEAIEEETRKLIYQAAGHWGSKRYDFFQNLQRGIKP